jgi:nicotinamidase-related amidase
MDFESLIQNSRPFLEWVVDWRNNLGPASLDDILGDKPEHVAILSVDLVKGFCSVGPLSSKRVNAIVEPAVKLFTAAYDRGVRHIILSQDAHPEDSVEFTQYGPHCIRGTEEAETVEAIAELPFADTFMLFETNSVSSAINTGLDDWLDDHLEVTTFIVIGDCTDICTYQLAMHLRLRANEFQRREDRVVLPVNAVDTYDLPVEVAEPIDATPHDAELLHLIFLYHMMLNGIEVVTEITAE